MTEIDKRRRIAIAESCGAVWWCNPAAEIPHRFLILPDQDVSHRHVFEPAPSTAPIWEESLVWLPDYERDLNALKRAEDKLNREINILPDDEVGFQTQFDRYQEILEEVVGRTCAEADIYGGCISATAAQRYESLCRLLNIWE